MRAHAVPVVALYWISVVRPVVTHQFSGEGLQSFGLEALALNSYRRFGWVSRSAWRPSNSSRCPRRLFADSETGRISVTSRT